jgi:hypothetical protein
MLRTMLYYEKLNLMIFIHSIITLMLNCLVMLIIIIIVEHCLYG